MPTTKPIKLATIDPKKVKLAPTKEEKAVADLVADLEAPEVEPKVDPMAVPYGYELLWGPFPAKQVKGEYDPTDPFALPEILDVQVRLLADDREHYLEVFDGATWDRMGGHRCPTDIGAPLARRNIKVASEHLALLSKLPTHRRQGQRVFNSMPKGANVPKPRPVERAEVNSSWGSLVRKQPRA